MDKAQHWREWGINGMPADKIRLADATWEAAFQTCAGMIFITRSDAQLMAGEMTAQEWRTVSSILRALQSKMRSNTSVSGAAVPRPIQAELGGNTRYKA